MDSLTTVVAGVVASLVFAASALPMLAKAFRSKDLTSYSRGNLVLANVGNAVYSVYVFSLPFGPDLAAAHLLRAVVGADARVEPALRPPSWSVERA